MMMIMIQVNVVMVFLTTMSSTSRVQAWGHSRFDALLVSQLESCDDTPQSSMDPEFDIVLCCLEYLCMSADWVKAIKDRRTEDKSDVSGNGMMAG